MFNFPSLAEYFLSHGGYINEKDEFGHTALHHAARNNNTEMVEFLISHGANISERDDESETALHIAAHYNCKKQPNFLLDLVPIFLKETMMDKLLFIMQHIIILKK